MGVQHERHDYQTTLPQSRVFRAARGAKRHAGRPSALPLQRVWRLEFGETHGTPMYRLHTSAEEVAARFFGSYAPGQP
jgi:hypothetical protein